MMSRDVKSVTAIAVASLVCVTAFAGPATAAKRTRKPPPSPQLAGTTVVKGAAPAVTRVSLPSPARIYPHRALTATGGGRFVGFVLRPAGAPMTDTRTIVGGNVNFCESAGCEPDGPHRTVHGFGFTEAFDGGQNFALPAGDYDLYLMTDGAPAQLTIALDGIAGTSEVAPQTPVAMNVDSPAPSSTIGGIGVGPSLYSAGSESTVGEPGGLTFHAVTVEGTGPGDSEAGVCWYEDGPPADGNFHGCLGATWGQSIGATHGPGLVHRLVYGVAIVAPRAWGLGGFAEALLPVADPHYFSVALTYRGITADTGTAPASTSKTRRRARAGVFASTIEVR